MDKANTYVRIEQFEGVGTSSRIDERTARELSSSLGGRILYLTQFDNSTASQLSRNEVHSVQGMLNPSHQLPGEP